MCGRHGIGFCILKLNYWVLDVNILLLSARWLFWSFDSSLLIYKSNLVELKHRFKNECAEIYQCERLDDKLARTVWKGNFNRERCQDHVGTVSYFHYPCGPYGFIEIRFFIKAKRYTDLEILLTPKFSVGTKKFWQGFKSWEP